MNSKSNWTSEVSNYFIQEDNLLRLLVPINETKNWVEIAKKMN